MADYDIVEAFERIEKELMESMIRNLDHHRAMETDEGFEWSQWQVEQLKALENYKKKNRKKYGTQFEDINKQLGALIYLARNQGNMEQEIKILEAIKNGFTDYHRPTKKTAAADAAFFRVNDRKIDALIEATTNDFKKAEHAMLRRANDQYRKIIYNAQVYANAGGTTYEKAVDMAMEDFLKAGINCIEYANGSRHTMKDYADMCIRTATKRAYLTGEGEKRKEWGISLVIMNKRGNPCPKCLPFVGKIMVDDVWSGGKSDGKHLLMSKAIEQGLYHPRCKDSHTTYFEGINTMKRAQYTEEEKKQIVADYNQEQKANQAKRQAEQQQRMADMMLDKQDKEIHGNRSDKWDNQYEKIKSNEETITDELLSKKTGAKVDLSSMDEKVAKEYRIAINNFYEQYPEMRGYLDEIGTKITTFGATGQSDVEWKYIDSKVNITSKIEFRPYKDYESYKDDIIENFKNGSKFENDDARANAYHELSHALQQFLTYSEKGIYKDGSFTNQSVMADLRKLLDVSSDSNKVVRSALKKVGGKDYNYHELTDYLGTYAQKNNSETLAQAMAYEMSGKTNPFSAQIKRNIDDRYEKLFGVRPGKTFAKDIDFEESFGDFNIKSVKKTIDEKKRILHDLKNDFEPITLDQLPTEHKWNVKDIIKNAPDDVKKIINKYYDDINIISFNPYKIKNHYSRKERAIRVNIEKAAVDERGAYVPLFHEIGHNIDHLLGNVSNNRDFAKLLENDFDNIVNGYMKVYNCDIETAYSEIGKNIKSMQYHSVSDISSIITRGKCKGKYGHNEDYNDKVNVLEKEAFAHFFEAYTRNDVKKLNILEQMFPNALYLFYKMIGGV